MLHLLWSIYSSLPQIYEQTSEKYQACLNIFHSKCSVYSSTSQIYEQTSEKYQACLNIFHSKCSVYSSMPQIYEQTSEKYQACLNIFHSKCSVYSSMPQIYGFYYIKVQKKIFFVKFSSPKDILLRSDTAVTHPKQKAPILVIFSINSSKIDIWIKNFLPTRWEHLLPTTPIHSQRERAVLCFSKTTG